MYTYLMTGLTSGLQAIAPATQVVLNTLTGQAAAPVVQAWSTTELATITGGCATLLVAGATCAKKGYYPAFVGTATSKTVNGVGSAANATVHGLGTATRKTLNGVGIAASSTVNGAKNIWSCMPSFGKKDAVAVFKAESGPEAIALFNNLTTDQQQHLALQVISDVDKMEKYKNRRNAGEGRKTQADLINYYVTGPKKPTVTV